MTLLETRTCWPTLNPFQATVGSNHLAHPNQRSGPYSCECDEKHLETALLSRFVAIRATGSAKYLPFKLISIRPALFILFSLKCGLFRCSPNLPGGRYLASLINPHPRFWPQRGKPAAGHFICIFFLDAVHIVIDTDKGPGIAVQDGS